MGRNDPTPKKSGKADEMAGRRLSRRGFLTWLVPGSLVATAVLVVDQVLRFLSFQPLNGETTVVPIGQLEDYPLGSLTYVREARAYVGRDTGGLYALDAVCPHLGCLVEPGRKDGFRCPCHGSRFDAVGQVLTGPATGSLRYLYLWWEDGDQLMIDRAGAVGATARLIP
jgi:cytochrome b6-f complex iron-sulfur subunit